MMRRAGRRSPRGVATALLSSIFAVAMILATALGPLPGRGEPIAPPESGEPAEPPVDLADGEDLDAERGDSLGAGDLEVGVGLSGRGRGSTRRRHVRFRDDSLDATVRDGDADPLAGAAVVGSTARGRFGVGREAPRWGRGLVLGGATDPWDPSGRARRWRKRSADVAWYRAGLGALEAGALCGKIGGTTRGGLEAGAAGFRAGLVGDRAGITRVSLAWQDVSHSIESALDRAGRWRTEAATARRGSRGRLALLVRAGSETYRSIAVSEAAGPARAFAGTAEYWPDSLARRGAWASAHIAWWRFRPGRVGSRASLEVVRALAQHSQAILGCEEQHGTRRDDPRTGGERSWRQGLWAEWRGSAGGIELGLRHEGWGRRSWARRAVRRVDVARLVAGLPGGVEVRVTHAVFRVRRGEHLYLPEQGADRLTLRAISGDGERTRVEARVPFAGGSVQAALNHTIGTAGPPRLQWTLDWTRRTRIARGRRGSEGAP